PAQESSRMQADIKDTARKTNGDKMLEGQLKKSKTNGDNALADQLKKSESNDDKTLEEQLKKTEINWDYALIERLNKADLSNTLIPFNLGKAIADEKSAENHLLQPGDVITIFSKEDIQVPIGKRSVYVRLEGEINAAGVYKVQPGETLRQLVERVGGLTPNAYLFGAELNRDSVREMQQKRLQTMADRMEADINRNLVAKQQTEISPEGANNAKIQAEAQMALVHKIRNARATGRVVLEMPAQNATIKDIPDIALEDGDQFVVPSTPSTVNVMGMVYNENTFIHHPGKHVSDYLEQAGGPTRDADESRIYLLRADGSVLSARKSKSILSRFSGDFGGSNGEELMPGDTVVVPELLDKFAFTKELKDWSQIIYQFALGVAGIKILNL
ncbi:partial Polysialic acid transport protein KpsD, partial [Anaerolineae bacterium]